MKTSTVPQDEAPVGSFQNQPKDFVPQAFGPINAQSTERISFVVVTLRGGAFEWDDRRYLLQPMAFELVRGERRSIELLGYSGGGNNRRSFRDDWWVSFSEDGHTVILNDTPFSTSLPLVNSGNWEEGQAVALSTMGVSRIDRLSLSGMVATVRFKPLPGMPSRVILERR